MRIESRQPGWLSAAALALIGALAAAFRFFQLQSIPPGFHYDEAYEALEAWRVITQPGYHPIFFAGNFGVEPMFIYLTSLAFRVLGAAPIVIRGVAALAGTLTVLALYGLGRELVRADDRIPAVTPLLAAAALAIMRWHVLFSRVGIEPVLVPLLLVIILWAFWQALRTGGMGAWVALGVATGLSPYTYPAGRLLPVVVLVLAVAALVLGWGSGGRRATTLGFCLAAAIALVVVAPLAWNFVQHPEQLLLRSSQIAVGTPSEARGSAGSNLLATLGMFSFRGDADPRSNVPGMSALDWVMAIPFYLGIFIAVWWLVSPDNLDHVRPWRGFPLASLFVVAAFMLAPTVFSEYAPHFRRALGAAPIVALFTGIGLGAIVAFSRRIPHSFSYLPAAIIALILAASAYLNAQAYFVTWGQSAGVYYAYDQGLWEIGQYVAGLPEGEPVYISPRPAGDMTLAFAWRDGRPVRHFDGRHAFIAGAGDLPGGSDAIYIVIEHEDFRGARLLKELYPDAVETRRFLDRDGAVYARGFSVHAAGPPARRPRFAVDSALGGRWDQPPVSLMGYDLDSVSHRPGETFYLQLWWRRAPGDQAEGDSDWTVFTHLLGPARSDGSVVWAGQDACPGQGSVPTSSWLPDDLVLDEYQLHVPEDAPPGDYQIEIGFYNAAAGGVRARTSRPPGQDHLVLGSVRVE